jgi:hypothetical protein
MIIELICAPLLLLVRGILSLIPVLTYIPNSIADTITMLVKGMQFFPFDVWFICISSFVFWLSVHLIYGFINFILRLIPLLNMGQ